MGEVWLAFGLTLFAGLATGIGSLVAFFAKKTNYRFLSVATGFSAGVMLYVSFVEILIKGAESLTDHYGDYWGHWVNTAAFFSGMFLIGLIDSLVPSEENPHETPSREETNPLHDPLAPIPDTCLPRWDLKPLSNDADDPNRHKKLMRMGLFTALAITIHNFPEGLATFLAALHDPSIGVAIAIAVALHNIPEGISVSVPIYYATGSRKKALFYSFLSGLAEPLGAIFAYMILLFFVGDDGIPEQIMGILFGGIAGIMVYISLDELLPTSRAYGKGHDSLIGLVAGMLVMALSLLLMR